MSKQIARRKLIKNLVLGGTAIAAAPAISLAGNVNQEKTFRLKNEINHSVCRWTYGFMPLDDLCQAVKEIGFSAIDLVGPSDWETLKKHGIYSSMCNGAEISLTKGWNHTEYHPTLIKSYTEHIDLVAKAGYKNLICFSGNREGMDEETGWKNCVDGLKQIMKQAEQRGVIIQM